MRYQHPKGEDSPKYTGIRGVFRTEVDADGTFDVEGVPVDVLRENGYEPVELPTENDEDDTDGSQEESDPLEGLSEDDLVEMNGNEIKSLASDFDDLDGRKSADELLEQLILKLRE